MFLGSSVDLVLVMKYSVFSIILIISLLTLDISQSKPLPQLWIKYLKWIHGYFNQFPTTCLPQIVYPNQMMLSAYNNDRYDIDQFICCLPPVIVWNPLHQFPLYFSSGINCFMCENAGFPICTLHVKNWNICQDVSSQPRILKDIDGIVLLIGINYICDNNHRILSYDSCILSLFPEHFAIPFALAHRSGFTKRLLDLILAHVEQGLDFSKTVKTIEACHSHFITHTRSHCLTDFNYPRISRFTITSIFLSSFFQKKEEFFNDNMRSLTCRNGWISIDHTFKISSNIGYFRSDKKWIAQYNSVFFVMDDEGKVLTWQFTKTEATAEIRELLEGLYCRSKQKGIIIHSIILDNCCQWWAFLQDYLDQMSL